MIWGLKKAYVIRLYLKQLDFEYSKTFRLYISGKTSSSCWRTKCGETASLKNFYQLSYNVQCCFLQSIKVPRNSLQVVVIVMYPDETYTRKISISILKCSTFYTRPTLHYNIHSVNPFTYRNVLSIEG